MRVSSSPSLVTLASQSDDRGQLSVVDRLDGLPFVPVRMFTVTDVPKGAWRGAHAQRTGHELLLCVSGSCTVETTAAGKTETFVLDRPDQALYVPPMVWLRYRHASRSTALVVLASTPFDPAEVIEDHARFVAGRGLNP